jgi:hypothetical protein
MPPRDPAMESWGRLDMTRTLRSMALVLVAATALGGALAPYVAAQQPTMPAQPDPYADQQRMDSEWNAAYATGAVIANFVYVPGKAILCGLGSATGFGLLVVTFGSAYRAASGIAHEGCAGRWLLRGDDLRPSPTATDWDAMTIR